MSRFNNIMNNIMDIIIISVRIGISWVKDEVVKIKEAYFDKGSMNSEVENTSVKSRSVDGIWNGGTTISKSDTGIEIDDITDTPYDVIYDGVYEDGKINE